MPETSADCARLFSIPAHEPFMETLAKALCDGTLIEGFRPLDDPLLLSSVTLYLPTRRSARALPEVFQEIFGGRPVLLPDIRPIGDVDEDGLVLGAADAEPLPPSMAPLERQLAMTRLVLAWKGALRRDVLAMGSDEPFGVPASAADAAWLAGDLLSLMDEVATEEADWSGLAGLVPEDHARYWQITLDFLNIVREAWPAFLKDRGQMDAKARRSALIRRQAQQLAENPPNGPVIVAGATGSVPATAELLKTVAGLPKGAIVLPGLDFHLDDASWALLGETASPKSTKPASVFQGGSVVGHPQYGLNQLLRHLNTGRDGVRPLGRSSEAPELTAREKLVSEAMRPADTSDQWPEYLAGTPETTRAAALGDVGLIIARNEVEEALAVAVALREAVERGEMAALVSPDRMLARRVIGELARWNIAVDDSAGRPLDQTAPAILAGLGAKLALGGCDPIDLLSLLKHPLARLGLPVKDIRAAARVLERGVLRGPRPRPGTAGLMAALEASRRAAEIDHTPRWKKVHEGDWDVAADLVTRLAKALRPLEELAETGEHPVEELVECHIKVINELGVDENGQVTELYAQEAGEALAATLLGLTNATGTGLTLKAEDWPSVFSALIAGEAVRSRLPGDPRVQILGPMEARLQRPDLVVLGGLNEGVWPQRTRNDPWLNRPMKRDIGLDPPERRIGAAAHDFTQGLGANRVLLARAARADGAPTVASRWLQRVLTLAGPCVEAAMAARGAAYIRLAGCLDRPDGPVKAARRPDPKPPVVARPKGLSITEIEKLVRDPYAIFARHVLGLQEVDPIGGEPGAADKGTIIHDALAEFLETWKGEFDQAAVEELIRIGETHFEGLEAFPAIRALWWPRFESVASAFVAYERQRAPILQKRHLEISGGVDLAIPGVEFRLRGRADRIDVLADGTLSVIDYKTGQVPTKKQVEALLAPQMPLEAAMIERGGFSDLPVGLTVSDLLYIQLKGGREALKAEPRNPKDAALADLIHDAWQRLEQLAAAYANPEKGYLSRARVMLERQHGGPYDHLARVQEWSVGAGDDE